MLRDTSVSYTSSSSLYCSLTVALYFPFIECFSPNKYSLKSENRLENVIACLLLFLNPTFVSPVLQWFVVLVTLFKCFAANWFYSIYICVAVISVHSHSCRQLHIFFGFKCFAVTEGTADLDFLVNSDQILSHCVC